MANQIFQVPEEESSFTPSASLQSSSIDQKSLTILSPDIYQVHIDDAPNKGSSKYEILSLSSPSPQIGEHQSLESALEETNNKSASISAAFLVHQASLILDDTVVQDFASGSDHLSRRFTLSAERVKPLATLTTEEIMRLSTWWFLLGRMKLESLVNEGSSFPYSGDDNKILLQQAHIDIAKAIWILRPVFQPPERFTVGNEENTHGMFSLCLTLLVKIRKSVQLMERHGLLVLGEEESSLSPELDTSIWIPPPSFGVDVNFLIHGPRKIPAQGDHRELTLSESLPLGDTADAFHFNSMYTDVFIFDESSNSQQIKYPAILSIIRERNRPNISVVVAGQDGLFKFSINSSKDYMPTWENVTWILYINSLEVKLQSGFRLQLRFSPWDFKTLRDTYDHYSTALAGVEPSWDEVLIFSATVKTAEYRGSRLPNPDSFPRGEIPECKFRLFEKAVVRSAGTGPRWMHRGFRIASTTPTTFKNLSTLIYDIPPERVIQFLRVKDTSLSFKFDEDGLEASLTVAFAEPQQRHTLLAYLTGSFLREDETELAQIPLGGFSFGLDAGNPTGKSDILQWTSIRVINKLPSSPNAFNFEGYQPVLAESLRIVIDSALGRITDRVNVGIGELKIRRNVLASGHELQILRQPQKDLTFSLFDLPHPSDISTKIAEILNHIQHFPTIRIYKFHTLSELHIFQSAITGFTVLYDGTPSSFSISRRRLMVPFSKKWTPAYTRVQVLRRGKIIQIAAFFEGFNHGRSMNFAVKETDVFEKSLKGKEIILRMVDAKFALPAGDMNEEEDSGFACLDLLEYPGEHSNIDIGFESQSDYSSFSHALPAFVKAAK